MPDKQTLEYYSRQASQYQKRMAESEFPYAAKFAQQLNVGERVLDLGCGPGQHSAYFASQGLIVDAIDASEEMVALANSNEGVNASVSSFEAFTTTEKYNGIWANFSLLHADKRDMPTIIRKLREAANEGALFHLGMKAGKGTATDRLGRFYTYYTPDELETMIASAGFSTFKTELGSGKGMAGKDEPWVILWAKA